MYSIKHNSIYRDGEVIAEIKANGLVEFTSPEFEKYRLPVWNHLDSVGRINKVAGGQDIAVWYDEADAEQNSVVKENLTTENSAPVRNAELDKIMQESENESKLVINYVEELREVVEKMTGEPAPFMSQSLGDATPELWDYFRRHIDYFDTIKAAYIVNVNLNRLYK